MGTSPCCATMRLKLCLLVVSLCLLVGCDHATKHWAESSLRAAPRIELVQDVLDLRYTANHDNAFSLSRLFIPKRLKRPVLIGLGMVAVGALGAMWVRRRRAPKREHLAYVLLMAGALGNLIDRFVRGYVVDFIHLHHWPVFNVADALIVAGAGLLLLSWPRQDTAPGSPAGPVPANGGTGPSG